MTEVLSYHGQTVPLLRQSARAYVRGLSRGTLAILISVFLGIGASILAGLARGRRAPAIVPAGYDSLPLLVALAGIWVLTRADPCLPRESKQTTLRWLLRATALAMVGGTLAPILIADDARTLAAVVTLVAIDLLRAAVRVVNVFALFILFHALARRLPNLSLARRTRTLMWCVGGLKVGEVVGIAGGLLLSIAGRLTGRIDPLEVGAIHACVFFPFQIAFGLWWIVVLREYYVQFTRQITFARKRPRPYGQVVLPVVHPTAADDDESRL